MFLVLLTTRLMCSVVTPAPSFLVFGFFISPAPSMATHSLVLTHRGRTRALTLPEGCEASELQELLTALFVGDEDAAAGLEVGVCTTPCALPWP